MDTLLQLIILVLGFIVLIKGADFFIDGAASIAKNLKVPDILVGLTIVSFGTSAPEAAVSIKAMASGNAEMVLGNVIGSNILNILLIVGFASCIYPMQVKNNTIKKELPFTVLMTMLFVVLINDVALGNGETNMISRADGIIILLFFSIFMYYLFTLTKSGGQRELEPKYTLGRSIIFTTIGLVCVVLGGNFVVESATAIALSMGVGQKFVSLTIVALGTSLPELVTSITAARKQEQDLALGNIIGSNIFNICFVVGLPATVFGPIIPQEAIAVDVMVMLIATVLLYIFSASEREISKKEGMCFILMFIAYYTYLVISQLGII